jgi:phospholipid transport system substrate-binding protein
MVKVKGKMGNTLAAARLSRRSLLGLAVIATTALCRPTFAGTDPAGASATIQLFNAALLIAMKAGRQTVFIRRFQVLAPAIDEAFDLRTVIEVSVGPGWKSLAPDAQSRLLEAFRRYTVASYVADFDSYDSQRLTVSPETRGLASDRVVVQSRILPVTGDATELDYVMQRMPLGWKVVDVLAAGSISRVAVQRSDFRHLLSMAAAARCWRASSARPPIFQTARWLRAFLPRVALLHGSAVGAVGSVGIGGVIPVLIWNPPCRSRPTPRVATTSQGRSAR